MNRLLLSFAIAFCFASTFAIAEDDQVYLQKGAGIRGKVVGSTNTQIGIEAKGSVQKLNVNEVRLITFGDEPQELRLGRARATTGKFDTAFADLKRANPAAIEREIVKRDLQFYLALCEGRLALSTGGDKAKATKSMMAFVKAAPKSNHFFEAARLLGDLAVGQGDYANAVKFYGAIASKAPWSDYKMSASLAEAQALVAKGDFPAAEKKFNVVAKANGDTSASKRQILLAQIGKGRCMAETGSAEEGVKLIEKIIRENEPVDGELFGRAYNAHGDCLQKAGKAKEALMSYLHVDVLFYSEPEIHAESLYHLSKLWATAKKPDRAAAAKTMLERRYAGSMWSKKD